MHSGTNAETSRDQQSSVLSSLRALVPKRRLTASETFRVAELQANHLLRYFAIETSAVPDEIIGELARIRVVRRRFLPVSGSAHWNGRHWVITLNADEPPARQRFSLMHEFKHVIDHTTKEFLADGAAIEHAGGLEEPHVQQDVQRIMEGGVPAFVRRERRYNNELNRYRAALRTVTDPTA